MRREEILSKGHYAHPQVSDLISVKQYIVLKHKNKNKKLLLLRFNNERNEVATGISLRIHQLDVRGDLIDIENVTIKGLNIAANADFALENPIVISDKCVDFKVEIVTASYHDYTYRVIDNEAHITYEKENNEPEKPVDKESFRAKLGGKRQAVTVRTVKSPVVMVIACIAILLALATVGVYQLFDYMSTETCFTLDHFDYEFMTENKVDGPIRLIRYTGRARNLIIPATIEGYPIGSIAKGAFSNVKLVSISIEGNPIIEGYAFYDSQKLERVSLGSSTVIEDYAFANCPKMSEISLGTNVISIGNNCFENCTSIKNINLPETLLEIGDHAFIGCTSLTSLVIPEGAVSIGDGILKNCTSINSLVVPFLGNEKETYDKIGFFFECDENYDIPASLTSVTVTNDVVINDGAFEGCNNIKNIEYMSNVTHIGSKAFSGCTGLVGFNMPSSLIEIGEYAFENCASISEIKIPDGISEIKTATFIGCSSISSLTLPAGLITIGQDAFKDCQSLKALSVPSTVATVGANAFMGLKSVASVTLPFIGEFAGDDATFIEIFGEDIVSSLRDVTITSSESIANGAFKGLTSLKTVFLADSIISIGEDAFNGCEGLVSIDFSPNLMTLGKNAFANCSSLALIKLPETLTSLEEGTFENCSSLYNITVPDSVTNIGANVFKGCTSLGSIDMPNSITEIGESAFYGCYTLSSISLPSAVTEIKASTFENCTKLSVIAMPATVYKISDRAFAGCTSMTGIRLPSKLTTLGNQVFEGCTALTSLTIDVGIVEIGSNLVAGCTSLTNLTAPFMSKTLNEAEESGCISYLFGLEEEGNAAVPQSLAMVTLTRGTVISDGAFEGCKFIKAIVLPTAVQQIGNSAFKGCESLANIAIPEYVDSIGKSAFENCVSLSSVRLPKVLTTINNRAFAGCVSLTELTLPGSVKTIGEYAFLNCKSLINISVPNNTTSMGQGIFNGCEAVTTLKIPFVGTSVDDNGTTLADLFGGVVSTKLTGVEVTSAKLIPDQAFSGFTHIKNLVINDGIISIGNDAFNECNSLESIVIPKTVTNIGTNIFAGCNSLSSLSLPFVGYTREIPATLGNMFADSVPEALKSVTVTNATNIWDNSFIDCSNIEEVSILSKISSIGNNAFRGCTSLKAIEIPESINSIGEGAFYNCMNLGSIDVPANLTFIGNDAFLNCYRLFEIFNLSSDSMMIEKGSSFNGYLGYYALNIYDEGQTPSKVESEGYNFLRSVDGSIWYMIDYTKSSVHEFPASFTYGDSTITAYEVPAYLFYNDDEITSVTAPESVKNIGAYAFWDCDLLQVADLSAPYLSEIALHMFDSCDALENVIMSDTVLEIREGAFLDCVSLKDITMSRGLVSIENQAFYNCESLSSVTLYYNVVEIANDAFWGCSNLREVYNVSTLPIVLHGEDYGYVAYYAYILHNSLDKEKLHEVVIDNLVFLKSDDNWFLTGHNGTSNTINLTSFVYLDKLVDSYIIVPYAFKDDVTIENANIGNEVKFIGNSAFANATALKNVSFENNNCIMYFDQAWFENCTALETFVFPTAISSISEDVFSGYNNLKVVSFKGNVSLRSLPSDIFKQCSSLQEITMPDGLSSIANHAFYSTIEKISFENCVSIDAVPSSAFANCYNLKTVILPESITRIEDNAFKNCSSLNNINMPSSLSEIGSYAFDSTSLESLTIPSNVSVIGEYAFRYCTNLINADLSAAINLTCIENNLFEYNSSLQTVSLPENITNIEYNAFYCCTSLEAISLPDELVNIEYNAFYNCTSLKSVDMQDKVTSIGYAAFSYCSALETVNFSDSLVNISSNAFSYCNSLKAVSLPSTVSMIDYAAFYDCNSLESVSILGCQSIYSYAFYGCEALVSVSLPNNLGYIDSYAFNSCSSLQSLTIPSSVYSIGTGAFTGCYSLREIWNLSTMYLEAGSSNHGDVARYAIIVHTYANAQPLQYSDIEENGITYSFAYAPTENLRYLYNVSGYSSGMLYLPENADGSYELSHLVSGSVTPSSVFIPTSVTKIHTNIASGWNYYTYKYYAGDKSQWQNLMNTSGISDSWYYPWHYYYIYTYVNCIHDYNGDTWMYDSSGNITTVRPGINETVDIEATCTSYGRNVHTCAACNTILYYTEPPILAHTFGEDVIITDATCTAPGQLSRTCTECGYTTYHNIDQLSHQYGDDVIVTKATCTSYGQLSRTCTGCEYTVYETIPMDPHQFGENGKCANCDMIIINAENTSDYLTFNDTGYTFNMTNGEFVSNNNGVHSSTSTMVFEADAAMTVYIEYSVSSESNYDYIVIQHNSETKVRVSGQISYQSITLELNAGDTITFKYTKDVSVDNGSDCATIHKITVLNK